MDSGVWCFYHVQGDRGESETHPNAFLVSQTTENFKILLEDFVKIFPLAGTGAFHFRFQVPTPNGKAFMDALGPKHRVPVINNTIIAKVLRMDTLKCVSASRTPLPLGSAIPVFKVVPESTPAPSRHASPAHTAPSPSPVQPVAATSKPTPAPAPKPAPPSRQSAPSPANPRSEDADLLFGGPVTVSPVGKVSAAPTNTSPLRRPARVDADLADKSEYVQAAVMARREEEARKAAERLEEVRAAERAKAAAEVAKDGFKATLGPKLKEWSEGMGGLKKDIRVLLSTLHTVLWPGAKWEETPISKLIDPNRVKFYFRMASRVVHPDHNNTAPEEQKFIATFVFHVLEGQYRTFEAAELNKA